ncbi:MAG TPA: MarR family transcriptional regulator [Acidimicrobiales bacterium]|jgi:DNA-binding MarR family transcriptional regulator|nr:MarR family transcriptional regulator [Acidimicrobiales bacterium]
MPKATLSSGVSEPSSEDLARVAESLSTLSRAFTLARPHEHLLKEAGVRLDRAGSALLFKLHRHRSEPLRVSDLADLLGIDTPSVTRKLQQLERLGYVASVPDPEDKRAKRISLTRSGEKTIDRMLAAINNRLARLFTDWTGEELTPFVASLERFAKSLTTEMENDRD